MQQFFDEITDFFSGKSKAPANPDPAHNVLLLQETRKKIETGILTRLLKRPTVYIFEIASYITSLILFVLAIYIWGRVDNIFDTIDTINFFNRLFNDGNLLVDDYNWISYCLLFVLLLPSVICFLLARLFTKSRKRTAIFIEVENMIDRIIYNLKG
ncbi:hypothetical protein [Lacibacter sp. H407]|uniref:hypothetical protein n=1 Tax=Lacibacter sp. H407 TaxID=3133423 RepID=UPI0030BB7F00